MTSEDPKSEFKCPLDEAPLIADGLDSAIAAACPMSDVIGARVD